MYFTWRDKIHCKLNFARHKIGCWCWYQFLVLLTCYVIIPTMRPYKTWTSLERIYSNFVWVLIELISAFIYWNISEKCQCICSIAQLWHWNSIYNEETANSLEFPWLLNMTTREAPHWRGHRPHSFVIYYIEWLKTLLMKKTSCSTGRNFFSFWFCYFFFFFTLVKRNRYASLCHNNNLTVWCFKSHFFVKCLLPLLWSCSK